jgi:hypothetical protein
LIRHLEEPDLIGLNVTALVKAAGLKPTGIPTAEQVRRLRVVTGTMPRLLPRRSHGDLRKRHKQVWQAMWLYGSGWKAPAIAKACALTGWKRPGKTGSVTASSKTAGRGQVFRILDQTYTAIAADLEPHLYPVKAAA